MKPIDLVFIYTPIFIFMLIRYANHRIDKFKVFKEGYKKGVADSKHAKLKLLEKGAKGELMSCYVYCETSKDYIDEI
jgi:uncharacterized protein YeaO (DUF488 family)